MSVASMAGIALGVAALIVVLSVMNGFERELRARILSVTSHATLMGLDGVLPDWQRARTVALATQGVLHAVPYVEAQAMVAIGARVVGTAVRGVDPANISFISAANKLKSSLVSSLSDPTEIDDAFLFTYSDRKKMGIACVRALFTQQQQQHQQHQQTLQLDNETAPYWNQVFESHKKKDDMADSLLQALSYLK